MHFTIPQYYGNTPTNTPTPLTGQQQLVSQGITSASNLLSALIGANTGSGIQASGGGTYYEPVPVQTTNYTPLIIGTLVIGGITVGAILLFRGKK